MKQKKGLRVRRPLLFGWRFLFAVFIFIRRWNGVEYFYASNRYQKGGSRLTVQERRVFKEGVSYQEADCCKIAAFFV
ncbi:MAG: hypothetical protein A3J54_03500 [Candidatus Ryanbacteria bacterium RIFCSPHIGHO2_02_FULL_45_13b]|uniref:Uncharacterized protein n=1 Tax=Candidatus Ryanbacteria bacterium RIFCSPHIGHO2_02_FULL_45_13b TaxID=1802117 RepID=A0A1G2G4J0_9BACT|nr:MAG: hypothetical protein A3J54_03500 [Candidatus Ryanbacteria bacterium RIFCSPHIGHO2_02_FULL_45_13b]